MAVPPGPSTAPRDPAKLRAARTAGAWNFARRGAEYFAAEELSGPFTEAQRRRTPALLGEAGAEGRTPSKPPLHIGRVTAVPLSKDAVGAVASPATYGPISYPFVVQTVAISTDIERFAPGDGLVISALPFDKGVSALIDNIVGGIEILGGRPDAAGTQFYAPGPTGQTAYFAPNIIVPEAGWFLRACGKVGGATPRRFGVILQIASLSPDDLANAFVPTIFPPLILQRSYRVAPTPRPRGPGTPRAVLIISAGARRVIPFGSLAPEILEQATDPETGAWRGTRGVEAIW